MHGLLSRNTLIIFGLFCCVLWAAAGCGDLDREGSGGTDKSGSILTVESVSPTYFDEPTNQVDVVRNNCADPGDPPEAEEYTDHYAEIKMTNRALPNAEEQTASTIYLSSYEIHYTPVTMGSPPLPSSNRIPITETVGIEPCEAGSTSCPETSFQAEFVPVTEKAVLFDYLYGPSGTCDQPTGEGCQLQYNVHYIFYGENDFGEKVSADGFSNFYASDYDHCGGG